MTESHVEIFLGGVQTTINRVQTARVIVRRGFAGRLDGEVERRHSIAITENVPDRIEITSSQFDGATRNRVIVVASGRGNIQCRGIRVRRAIATVKGKAISKVEVIHVIGRNTERVFASCGGSVEAFVDERVVVCINHDTAVDFSGIANEVLDLGIIWVWVNNRVSRGSYIIRVILRDVGDVGKRRSDRLKSLGDII